MDRLATKRRRIVIALGAGALAPFASFAQQQPARIPHVGFLGPTSAAGMASRLAAFQAGLRELGYTEGKNIFIDYRWAEGDYARLPGLAKELVQVGVDVIVTGTTAGTRAATDSSRAIRASSASPERRHLRRPLPGDPRRP